MSSPSLVSAPLHLPRQGQCLPSQARNEKRAWEWKGQDEKRHILEHFVFNMEI